MRRSILLTSLFGIAIAAYALAQEHPEHSMKQTAATEVIEATVEGENICLGCSLKKGNGAAAQCSKYGHRHALKVTTATAAGKELAQMKGWVLHYLDTDNAQPFIEGHNGATLLISGKVYTEERVFEVGKLEKSEEPETSKLPEHSEHPK